MLPKSQLLREAYKATARRPTGGLAADAGGIRATRCRSAAKVLRDMERVGLS